jgi:choline dehydrogenase-like flavoprotein
MLVDARTLPDGSRLEADLCIVGGGMAGIAIARELIEGAGGPGGVRIMILESGGEEPDAAVQDLYRGTGTLRDPDGRTRPFDDYLRGSRLRAFGGSGHVWGGKCGRLDPADFERRDWVPHSGWPFDRAHLDPFYDRAARLLELPSFRGDLVARDPARPPLALGDGRSFETVPRVHSPVTGGRSKAKFDAYRYAAARHPSVTVYLHANVTQIRTDPDGNAVTGLDVRCLERGGPGRRHSARARQYVLATGGMENARLLLLSTSTNPAGLGNDHGLVGRFFGGHLNCGVYGEGKGPSSGVAFAAPRRSLDLYTTNDPAKVWGIFNATPDAQRRLRLPNFWATFSPPSDALPGERAVVRLADATAARATEERGRFVPVRVMGEEPPNPDSRLTLGAERDALSQPRLHLDWRLDETHLRGIERGVALFGRVLGEAGAGRLRWPLAREGMLGALGAARHHIGTTRMHRDPRHGVVDEHCRVHGVANLHVAGSSVFPTGGIANPTFTIVALAVRLADRLRPALRTASGG